MDRVVGLGPALRQLEWDVEDVSISIGLCDKIDQLPSRDNLRRWGLTEDCKCELCGESETLHHVLSNCKYALDNGRYTWRHNKVRNEVVEATKMAIARANSRKIILQRKVYFLREDFSLTSEKNRLPPRRDILAEDNDWIFAADL